MRAVVLSVGSELLRGDIVDTNASYLTRQLSQLGFEVRRVQQIGDDLADLTAVVRESLEVADTVVTTGGLGPTADDLTRDAIAGALGEEQTLDESLVADIEARFASLRRPMPASNLRQAMRIRSAEAIPNANGTAPGWFVESGGKTIVALPGPPGEMQPMWIERVERRLEAAGPGHRAVLSLLTFGVGESTVELRIADVIARHSDVIVATYAKATGVEVHVTARADSPQAAAELLRETKDALVKRLGSAVVGFDGATLASVAGRLLRERALTLAVMESATGGRLASMVTDVAGSSEYFAGGIVAYTESVKAAFGVDRAIMQRCGLISAETAQSMAAAAREALHAEVGVGVSGIAGSEPVEGQPAGTCFVATDCGGAREVREIHRPGRREASKEFFALCALDLLRRQLSATPESEA